MPLQSESVISQVRPKRTNPSIGRDLEVIISVDMSGMDIPNNRLGSFSGSLWYDPSIIRYRGDEILNVADFYVFIERNILYI